MFRAKFPLVRQSELTDCGPACLAMVLKYYGKNVPLSRIKDSTFLSRDGTTLLNLKETAYEFGLSADGFKLCLEDLKNQRFLPCIAHWDNNHFVVVYKFHQGKIYVADPRGGRVKYNEKDFLHHWADERDTNGLVLLLSTSAEFIKSSDKQDSSRALLSYLKEFKRYLLILTIGLILGSIIQLIFPFLTQALVDIGIKKQDLGLIYLLGLGQLLLFIGQILGEAIRRWVLIFMSARVNITIIKEFLSKLMRLPLSYFDSKLAGDILMRIEDHARIERFISTSSLNVLFSVVNLLIFSLVLISYNILIFWIFLIMSIGYVIYIWLFLKKRKEFDIQKFGLNAKNQSALIQIIVGMTEIKMNSAQERKEKKWVENQEDIADVNIEGNKYRQFQELGGGLINQLKNILITFISARAVVQGDMTLGMMISVQYIIGQLNAPLTSLLAFFQELQDAMLSISRIEEVKNMPDEEFSAQIAEIEPEASISVESIDFHYEGPHSPKVLSNISAHLPFAKTTAIVGTSGSGKTTLMKLLLKFYQPNQGRLMVGAVDLDDISSKYWREQCGVVMQDGYIFSDSIKGNICLASDIVDQQRLEYAMKISNANEFIERLPKKEMTMVGMDGSGLSQGQKQRILIARAVYKNPKYFFLDEATSALDTNNERIIYNNLQMFFKNKTVVVIAHRLSTVKNADHILVLEKGQLVESGTHTQLVQQSGYYFNLVKNQLELVS
ncbi:peptidase domain-containing ABC transporter [Fulvivirga sp. M361]|uniref:peptidase domain-containing ABC transporter n=1 Tax=Fulvivirga sp. M361 TaxID=2594266 RepID=UPI00117BBACA|nr:peptidase domain-containing ABC transporter [Fulvivirga sp. M361]TRX54773.1 peptidase domain-containing ABC transporter [Fulvivirga sp. M361]